MNIEFKGKTGCETLKLCIEHPQMSITKVRICNIGGAAEEN